MGCVCVLAIKRWVLRLRRHEHQRDSGAGKSDGLTAAAVVRAQGDLLALFASLFERHNLISAEEIARSLSEFAALTAEDRPSEGRILSLWASYAHDAAATFRDPPSVQ
jgi:hypothetical protein